MKNNKLSSFGFKFERGGAHTSRTLMLEELEHLLAYVDEQAGKDDFKNAIVEENCLAKRSGRTRLLTYRHLVDLYALDPDVLLFRVLTYFWRRDSEGKALLALLCAFARDSILRSSLPLIRESPEGMTVTREAMEEHIDALEPGRFSPATLKSVAQNLNSSWTKTGHLSGRVRKVRSRASATPGSVAYALLLGYLTGARGEALFKSEYVKLLDCSFEKAIELAEDASRRGWIVLKRVGTVIEVLFPNLITTEEMERLREQA